MSQLYRYVSRAVALTCTAGAFLLGGCTVERGGDGAQGSAPGSAQGTAPAGGAPASPTAAPGGTPAGDSVGAPASTTPAPTTPAPTAAAPDSLVDPNKVKPEDRPRADMRLEVDLKARQLYVYQGQARTAAHPVGVGTERWPTQTGEWVVSQVIWNPEWVPPDQSWADEGERKAPGDPDNPLGRAQLIYDPPRTVHGTNQPQSVGKASSHGSLRMRNAEIVPLARQVMEAAGVGEDEAWYRRVRENRTEKVVVNLPRVVPIRVY